MEMAQEGQFGGEQPSEASNHVHEAAVGEAAGRGQEQNEVQYQQKRGTATFQEQIQG
jgi:hypothetical protein